MPPKTFYLYDRHFDFLDAEADAREDCDNPDQALQDILDEVMGAEADE